jgi:hypothetical protein
LYPATFFADRSIAFLVCIMARRLATLTMLTISGHHKTIVVVSAMVGRRGRFAIDV